MEKIPTLKEFKDEVTPFIKAYKRKNTYENLILANELKIGDAFWFIDVEKQPLNGTSRWDEESDTFKVTVTKKQRFKLLIDVYKDENDEEGDMRSFEIESEDFTVTEIMDFLSFEYSRNVLKRK